jgi:putative MATE family efflux protein
MSKSTKDMTQGRPAKLITLFALPLMLGNIFQQMYTMADAAIVGQFAGVDALGALGSADWLCWLVFGVISGFMQGFSILVSQRFGAGDIHGMRRAVATIVILSVALSAAFTALGIAAVAPTLRLINTQERFFAMAQQYLYVLYGGITITAAYNMLSSILRALGNSRAPLIAMIVASATNIGLDLLFVAVFKWGVMGAAVATVIAQAIAAVICLFAVFKMDILRFKKGEFAFDTSDARMLFRLAAPMGLQNTIISVGGVALQAVINSLGAVYVSGFTATNKMYGLLEAAAISYGFAVTTYVGQNLGARKYDRIRKGVHISAIIGLAVSLVLTVIMLFLDRTMLSLFINRDSDPMVLDVATTYLNFMTVPLFILYMLHIYRSALQGMGDTLIPMVSGVAECVMRVGCAWLLTSLIGAGGIYFAEPAAWLGAAIILVSAYYYRARRLEDKFGNIPV